MAEYQIIQCDIQDEQISGTYETLELAKAAWKDFVSRGDEMDFVSMELIDDKLEVLDTHYWS